MLTACVMARLLGNRCLVTFHGGVIQPFLQGWRWYVIGPLYRLLFSLADRVICNSEAVKNLLIPLLKPSKIVVIPAFSQQYLTYETVALEAALAQFVATSTPLLSTYLCFRDGFFTDVVLHGVENLVQDWPHLGLVIVGTGDGMEAFRQQVQALHLTSHIYLAGNLERNAFLTLMAQSDVHLRSPISDGVSATVLEALSLRIPVVASENGARPPSVITYQASDGLDLAQRLREVLTHHADVVASLQPPCLQDTARMEVDLLLGPPSSGKTSV
jgi:glycosyltransferase involved in cell wall biosynthesis